MSQLADISNFDVFLYYGEPEGDLQREIESDLLLGFIQEKRSLYYNRQDSAGIRENYPNSFSLAIMTKYDITNWVAFRNTQVSDGTKDTSDRRAAVSQNYISFTKDTKGNLDIDVLYIPFFNFTKTQQLTIPIPGGL